MNDTCVRCGKPAEYDSPEIYCGECWAWWFTHNQPGDKTTLTPEEQEAYYQEVMQTVEESRKTDLTPVPNDNQGIGTMLGRDTPCPQCGSPPSEHEVRNHSLMWHDGDVHCTRCGAYVRMYDAG